MIEGEPQKIRVEVLLPKPFDTGFDYWLEGYTSPPLGAWVKVPFGKQEIHGVVWKAGTQSLDASKVKHVLAVVEDYPPVSAEMRNFVDFVADYTLSPRGMVLKMLLPVDEALEAPKKRERVTVAAEKTFAPALSPLSPAQQEVADGLKQCLFQGHSVTLLDGVTGSGKTEVYFDVIARLLQETTGQVLVLLPEIGLSMQWVERCEQRFGVRPHVWHSHLTPAQRRDTWRAIAKGQARLVVGARSALFLPYPHLQLIVVDEEHEHSYKQEDGVLYHGRDMAVARGHYEKIPVVLASATPSLESVWNVTQTRYRLASLPHRHGGARLPEVVLVDMRKERLDSGNFLSQPLRLAIAETLAAGHQAMLFLNRRGYAPLLLCRACGHRFACPECTSWMVTHKRHKHLQCHHCGRVEPEPSLCPTCGADDGLIACGPGVERVEEEVVALFPQAKVVQMTSDSTTSVIEAEAMVRAMAAGEIDIMVGTQMMAKGYHFPKLNLIGVVDADMGLQGGDLRANERTFQLLHQVAGRAGRESQEGKVLVQTYLPDHPVMQALKAYDRDMLEQLELKAREGANMPPFGRLAAIIVEGEQEQEVAAFARNLARTAPLGQFQLLGPAPAPLYRLRNRYRFRFLARSSRAFPLQKALARWLAPFQQQQKIRVKVDMNPYNFM